MNKEDAPGPMRAVLHPRSGAPWPLRAADGTRATEKEAACVMPASKLEATARDTALRAGPAKGIADACSHPENSRRFEAGYTWALQNKDRYLKELEEQSDDYQREKELRMQQAKRSVVVATVKTFAPDADLDLIPPRPEVQQRQDEDGLAYGLFEQEYSGVVHGVWSANKASVRRAGGTDGLLNEVWARLPPKKRQSYEFRASKMRRERQKMNDPGFQLAMQATNPTPLSTGSAASVEVTMNWLTRGSAVLPEPERRRVLSRSASVRTVKSKGGSRPQSAAVPGRGVVGVRSEGSLSRPTSAPTVALGQMSASTIGRASLESSNASEWFQSVDGDGLYQPGQGAVRRAGRLQTAGREAPMLMRHGQSASVRMIGHPDLQPRGVIVRDAVPLRAASPPEKASAADRGEEEVVKKTEEEKRQEAIAYWQWKASEARHTSADVHCQQIMYAAAITEAQERVSRPNSAESVSSRTPAAVGLVGSPPGSPTRMMASSPVAVVMGPLLDWTRSGTGVEHLMATSQVFEEPSWTGPGVDASGSRSASMSDLGRQMDQAADATAGSASPVGKTPPDNEGLGRRPSIDIATQGMFARRSVRVASAPLKRPEPVPEPQSAAAVPTSARPTTADTAKKVTIVEPEDDDADSQSSSVFSEAKSASSVGNPRAAMDALANFSTSDMDMVVRYHGKGHVKSFARPGSTASVGQQLRQRGASVRASAAATRVANARRLLRMS